MQLTLPAADASVKVSSTRLKPDEASVVLQEDGNETRVGGISIQIMADVGGQQQQQKQQQSTLDAASGTASTAGGGSAASSGKVTRTPVRPAEASGVKLGPRKRLGATSMLGKVGPRSLLSVPAAAVPLGNGIRSGAVGPAAGTTTSVLGGSGGGGGIKRTGLGGAGRGVGGARRFHAPRSSGAAAVVAAGANERESKNHKLGGSEKSLARRVSPGRGGSFSRSAGAGHGRDSGGGGGGSGGSGGSGGGGGGGGGASGLSPEGLVLEWTAGDPPQPVIAGASLARRLYPHQREGLKMLWECLAGRGGYEGRGAILADEMGLGKTATAIALCMCVLRHRRAECPKAVVVCPSSLVRNWANEVQSRGPGGGAVAVDQAGAAAAQLVSDFKIGAAARYPILVISYELYRNHGKVINATEGLGLLIADEGHRLKNAAETKTTRALKACPAVMRLVLTGTPMQNDLDEFFAVADFVNPGLLGSLKSFRSRYTRPIKAAWDRDANEDAAELSTERTRELGEMTEKFVLRRTKDVIRGSLPAALEVVVFCRPSTRQLSLYQSCIAGSAGARSLLYGDGGDADSDDAERGGSGGGHEEEEEEEGGGVGMKRQQQRRRPIGLQGVLPLISKLRRLCNHPDLVEEDTSAAGELSDEGEERQGGGSGSGKENSNTPEEHSTAGRAGAKGAWKVPRASEAAAAAAVRGGAKGPGKAFASTAAAAAAEAAALPLYETEASGKVTVLEALLKAVRREYPGDKVVVASNFTSALDVLETLAERNSWGFLRLDGGTTTNERQNLVDRFNRASPEDLFLFFLSAKAGGVGLNLVGANRIVLFDSDWNPATDDQAMARVWRLGQTKEVCMYRLLSTGTLEESIFQRQIFKGALYDLIHDSNDDPSKESGGSGGGVGRQRRGGGDDGTAAAAAAGKEGGGKSGRGFSQEELKELFVLKAETRSDTYDKLRRGRAAATPRAAGAAGVREGGRYQEVTLEREVGARGDGEEDGWQGPTAAAAPVVDVEEQAWEDYVGPSAVVDKALRLALLEEATGTPSQVGGSGGGGGGGVGGVVTFVREVKRGGRPEQQRGGGGVGTGGASHSQFAAFEGATGNGCGMEGNEA
ncbi:unnamed protein product [Ectocarpus sp. CCAP 1310/34]|nr:unnamed protein product [Ectocarpus sp. CCAP 1310/34]